MRTWWGFCDGIIKTNTFRATIAAWLDASIEVEMMFAQTGLPRSKCSVPLATNARGARYELNILFWFACDFTAMFMVTFCAFLIVSHACSKIYVALKNTYVYFLAYMYVCW